MGRFESYPEADALNDSDITLYNKSDGTYKLTFSRLVNLIKNKLTSTSGLVTSLNIGAGLNTDASGGQITSTGMIKCKLKSDTQSALLSNNITTIADRQYAVNLDSEGNLSVNVPWNGSTYTGANGISVNGSVISANLLNNVTSNLTAVQMGTTQNRQYAVGLDSQNKLSVNIPWTDTIGMDKSGSNANNNVTFAGNLTVGTRFTYPTNANKSMSVGNSNTVQGNSAIGTGISVTASGMASHAEGSFTRALGDYSHAEGFDTLSNHTSHSEGYGQSNPFMDNPPSEYTDVACTISSINDGAHAEGYTTREDQSNITGVIQSSGYGSHAEGCALGGQSEGCIIANGNGAHAEGYADCVAVSGANYIIASGDGSHAEGTNTTASGNFSHAEGMGSTASEDYAHAEGANTIANNNGAHAEGSQSTASGVNAHAEGNISIASGNASHSEGYNSIASANYTHAEGYQTEATKQYSHTEGYRTKTNGNGVAAHAEGESTIASGVDAHAEGYQTTASGSYSHAEGNNTQANQENAHAEGRETIASGIASHAEGGFNTASGNYAHAEGSYTTASGYESHAEGYYTQALASGCHAEGLRTKANADNAHAEGGDTTASGLYAHAEGSHTTASGLYSHAEGYNTTASNDYTHASGSYATASRISQFVHGGDNYKFNTSTNGRGVFGIQPDGQYYTSDTEISNAQNGCGGTLNMGVELSILLDVCSTYLLITTEYRHNASDSLYNYIYI